MKEIFYLMMHSTHFIYDYMASKWGTNKGLNVGSSCSPPVPTVFVTIIPNWCVLLKHYFLLNDLQFMSH